MSSGDRRILELDALRGLAALSVVLFHYTTRYDALTGRAGAAAGGFAWGEYGVDLFFMLSGFVILRSLDRTKFGSDFFVGRFARLYPAYWAAAAITFSAVSLFGLPGQEVGCGEAVLNATMLQRLFEARHIDGVYWSLEAELFFYALAFAVHRLGAFSTARRQDFALAVWLGAEAASVWLANNAQFETNWPLAVRVANQAQVLLSLRYAHLFAIGIVLYRGSREHRVSPAAWMQLAGCWTLQGVVDSWGAALGTASLTALLYAAAEGRLRWLAARPLVLLGAISYPLYLLHQNLGYLLLRELETRAVFTAASIAAALAFSLAAAAGLSLAIERPAQRWILVRWAAVRRAPTRIGHPAGPELPSSPAQIFLSN